MTLDIAAGISRRVALTRDTASLACSGTAAGLVERSSCVDDRGRMAKTGFADSMDISLEITVRETLSLVCFRKMPARRNVATVVTRPAAAFVVAADAAGLDCVADIREIRREA
jgi:hypothetical protein